MNIDRLYAIRRPLAYVNAVCENVHRSELPNNNNNNNNNNNPGSVERIQRTKDDPPLLSGIKTGQNTSQL